MPYLLGDYLVFLFKIAFHKQNIASVLFLDPLDVIFIFHIYFLHV